MAKNNGYSPDIRRTGALMRSPEMERMLKSAARKGAGFARGISPDGPPSDPHRGEYKASFRVTSSRAGAGKWADRAAAYLYNESPYAIDVETRDDYHILARTAGYIRKAGP